MLHLTNDVCLIFMDKSANCMTVDITMLSCIIVLLRSVITHLAFVDLGLVSLSRRNKTKIGRCLKVSRMLL